MKNFRLFTAVLLSFVFAFNAHADDGVISDLPGFENEGGSTPAQPSQPPTPEAPVELPPPPEAPVFVGAPGSVNINSISRKSGGTSYFVNVNPVGSVKLLEVRVNSGRVQIHQTLLILANGSQRTVRYLSDTDVMNEGSRFSSETLAGDRIMGVVFIMEAFGGEASINVAAIGNGYTPALSLAQAAPPSTGNPKPPPPPPPPGSGSYGGIKRGTRVVDSNGNWGEVTEVFRNGTVTVEFDEYSGSYTREIRTLGIGVRCVGTVCVGTRAIDSSGNWGDVKEVFSNGKARMEFDEFSGEYLREVSNLGVGVRCVGAVCVGTRAIDSSNNWGDVKEVFSNGKVRMEFDEFSGVYVREVSSLGVGVDCIRNVCKRSRVLDSNNSLGEVQEVFSNGKVLIEFDEFSGIYVRELGSLGLGLRCYNGFCVGDRVFERSNRGVIREVFSNGKARVEFDDYSGDYIRDLSSLSKASRR